MAKQFSNHFRPQPPHREGNTEHPESEPAVSPRATTKVRNTAEGTRHTRDAPHATPVAPDVWLPPDKVAEMLSISKRTLFRLVSAGKLPPPVYLTRRMPRWKADAIRQCLEGISPDAPGNRAT